MRATDELAPALRGLAERLAGRLEDRRRATAVARLAAQCAPDQRLALASLLKLAEQSPALLSRALDDRALARDLVRCLGSSELIAGYLGSIGASWLQFFSTARARDESALLAAMKPARIDTGDRVESARALADFKRRNFIAIAIADLLGKLEVGATMRVMSQLADQSIAAALRIAQRLAGAQSPLSGDFCVLAMGKLGVCELNLSSDLDLVYLFDAPDLRAAQEPVARLAELLTELLSADCFRIDLRLRPGGRNAPLVAPLGGALGFYHNFGQAWERAALLRARPVAGARELGRRFIAELVPFIYRRYLDFDTLSQLRAMKRQIEDELRSTDAIRRNIKLGYGGIRELEFIVQALILVYGGRDPRLRVGGTLAALERLAEFGYLEAARAREMAQAYLFLRDVEHKLQVVAGLQTHSLPADEPAMRALAARMGFGKSADALLRFQDELWKHRSRVAALFHEMLAGEEERAAAPGVSAEAAAAWQAASDPKAAAVPLGAMGFAAPAESAGHLELLALGPSHAPPSPRRRALLERIGPHLLDEIRALPDPDLALRNLAAFIAAVGARTSFLSLLEQHPATRRVLLSLFASSSYFSTLFIRHPDMLDTLVRSDLARQKRAAPELERELAGLLAACADFEARLDALRSFRHQEFLRIAIADLAGALALEDVQAELSALAETVVRQALAVACEEVAARKRISTELRIAVIAMGRLGAAEMNYNSDLDLIFVYRDPTEVAASSLPLASAIAQKLIAVLEARTREGYAYKIDVRLRPSGNAGPLVVSLDGFRDYHRQSSAVWERQALVRARVIAGDPALGAEVEAARQEFLYRRGLTAAEVGEIAAMRARMEHEIGVENRHRLNLKQGRGGLVDVEFIAQMMALRYGVRFPELRRRATLEILSALSQCKLITEADARELGDGYRFLSKLENRLRIESDQAAWALPTAPEELGRIARRMGYEGADAAQHLLSDLEDRRSRIRAIFDRYFAAATRD